MLKRFMRCNPLLPWHLQRTSQPGASRFGLFTQQCFAGYEGPISGITLAGLAGLPNEFLDFILLCCSGEPIGRDNAALIQRSIIAKTKSCEFCSLSALQVQLDYVSNAPAQTHQAKSSERASMEVDGKVNPEPRCMRFGCCIFIACLGVPADCTSSTCRSSRLTTSCELFWIKSTPFGTFGTSFVTLFEGCTRCGGRRSSTDLRMCVMAGCWMSFFLSEGCAYRRIILSKCYGQVRRAVCAQYVTFLM